MQAVSTGRGVVYLPGVASAGAGAAVARPLEKTMALGGVAMGSMNAQDAAIVAGSISRSGFTCSAWAVAAMMGSIMVVEAVLEVTSVKKVMVSTTAAITATTGTSCSTVN